MLKLMGGEPLPKNEVIPTPSFGINQILNGGFWTGRFSLLWGTPSAGKTTFLLHTMAEAQKMGYTPVIFDAEKSYNDDWAEKCGMDLSDRILIHSNVAETIIKEAVDLMKTPNKFAILIDSVNGIQSKDFFEDRGGMASGARVRQKLFMNLAEYLHPSNNVVFFVSQQTMDLGATHPMLAPKIGNAEKHWCTNIICLFASMAKDNIEREESKTITSREIRWTIGKSKQCPVEGTEGTYWFNPKNAKIDFKKEIVNLAVMNGAIRKAGAWFYIGEEEKYNGFPKLVEAVTDEVAEKLAAEMLSYEKLVYSVEKEKK